MINVAAQVLQERRRPMFYLPTRATFQAFLFCYMWYPRTIVSTMNAIPTWLPLLTPLYSAIPSILLLVVNLYACSKINGYSLGMYKGMSQPLMTTVKHLRHKKHFHQIRKDCPRETSGCIAKCNLSLVLACLFFKADL